MKNNPDLTAWLTEDLAAKAANLVGVAQLVAADLQTVGAELLSRLSKMVTPEDIDAIAQQAVADALEEGVPDGAIQMLALGAVVAWIQKPERTEAELVAIVQAVDDVPVSPDADAPPPLPADEPVPPDPLNFADARDRYAPWTTTGPEVSITEGMSPLDIRDALRGANGLVVSGTTVRVSGAIKGLYIGGGHTYAVSNADGSPLGDLRFIFAPGARVDGLKLGNSKGGIEGELRLVDPVLRAASNDDGTEMGDFAPLRMLDHMPGMHLVVVNVDVEVDMSWKSYDGFGIKWAVYLKTCRATFYGFAADPAREHSFYYHNTIDLFVQHGTNRTRAFTDAAGDTRFLGNGRTFEQHANRVPQGYPAGGNPSRGSIVFKDCEAVRCGWEGQLAWADKDGVVHPGNPNAGGGSDFTCHGHTGDVYALIDCKSTDPFAGSVACWNEAAAKNATDANQLGMRGWLLRDVDTITEVIEGVVFSPLAGKLPEKSWGTERFVVSGFTVTGERGPQQRQPFLISGARRVELEDLYVNGIDSLLEPLGDGFSDDVLLDHQPGVTPIETLVVDGEVLS